jgi:mannosyl-3-phosphoglycerate phosphatase family protein
MPRDYLKVTLLGLKTDGPFEVLELGTDVDRLRHALADAASACGVVLRTFGQMEVDEIATLTGLSLDQAARALKRRYDEPFLVQSGDSKKMAAMLRAKKLTVTRGDRFYHLSGGHSKRDAVEALLNLHRDQYGQVISIGLGNSANDGPMLSAVDRPVLVRNPDGRWDGTVVETIPDVERTIGTGPQGWREAIDGILDEATP